MSNKIKTVLKTAKMSFTNARLAYESGLEEGYQIGFAEGRRQGHAEGAKVWATMQAEKDKAAKAKV